MKKLPLYYNNQIVGYFDELIYNDDMVESAKIFIFKTDSYDSIVEQIMESTYLSFDKYIDKSNLNNNILYDFKLYDYFITCKRNEKITKQNEL